MDRQQLQGTMAGALPSALEKSQQNTDLHSVADQPKAEQGLGTDLRHLAKSQDSNGNGQAARPVTGADQGTREAGSSLREGKVDTANALKTVQPATHHSCLSRTIILRGITRSSHVTLAMAAEVSTEIRLLENLLC